MNSVSCMGAAILLLAAAVPPILGAQAPASTDLPTIAVPPVELELGSANSVMESDRDLHAQADEHLREWLVKYGAFDLLEREEVEHAVSTVRAGGTDCSGDGCLVEAGKALSADYVLLTRLTKLSNLIWFTHARLVDARTGKVVALEDLELKGVPQDIVLSGMKILARRMSSPEERAASLR